MTRVLAVDLGGTKTAIAAVDEFGGVERRTKEPADPSPETAVRRIARAQGEAGAAAVGIVVPGIYHPRTGMAWAPNLWGPNDVPLRDLLAAELPVPAVIESDRSGYVLGEQWLGAARGLRDVVFVAVGTGIGVGVLSGGRLVNGAHGIAGAAGWFALDPRWKPEYEHTGCWEAEAAGPAVARHAGTGTGEAALAAACSGDPRARAAFDNAAAYLAMGIANLVSLLDPEMIVLGGGLMRAAELLLPRIRRDLPRWAQPIAVSKVKLEVTALGEDAGLLGAARLAFLHTGIHKD